MIEAIFKDYNLKFIMPAPVMIPFEVIGEMHSKGTLGSLHRRSVFGAYGLAESIATSPSCIRVCLSATCGDNYRYSAQQNVIMAGTNREANVSTWSKINVFCGFS